MGLFSEKKTDQLEYIAVFLLCQQDARAWVCTVNASTRQVELIDEKKFTTTPTWDSLVYDIDEILFAFEKEHDIKLQKATFFVYSHLIDTQSGELQAQYLDVLKSVLAQNELESLGYIELEESLALSFAEFEHTPLNAVFVEVDMSSVFMCVYKGGRKLFHETRSKSASVINDIEDIIKSMPAQLLLPARIVMYDTPSVEHESHALLMHPWNDPHFIQIPQIGVVKESELKSALVHGVAQELFGQSSSRVVLPAQQAEEVVDDKPTSSVAPQSVQAHENLMGFVIGADVRTDTVADQKPSFVPVQEPIVESSYSAPQSEPDYGEQPESFDQDKLSLRDRLLGILSRMKSLFDMRGRLPSGIPVKKLIILACGLILVGGSVWGALYYAHSAKITVIYATEPIEDTIQLGDEVTLTEHKETISSSAKVATSGQDDVGEKAKGTCVIYNADDKSKTFDKGAKLKSADGLVFTLDKAVTVDGAKKTVTDDENILTSTSKASVTVTAEDIGTKYNIKKETKLSIEGFSDTTYFAKSESAFTGGSSKQIQTVDKADYAALDKKIKADIDAKSAEKLRAIAGTGGIVKDLTVIDTTGQTYSKEIAEEAKEVSSQVKADVVFYSLDDSQVKKLILDKVRSQIPDGYLLATSQVTFRVTKAVRDKKTKKVTITVASRALPQLEIDKNNVIIAVKGKDIDSAEKVIRTDFKAEGIDAVITTPLPFLRSRIPYFSKHISVDLKALN